jgi:hypothetical protein
MMKQYWTGGGQGNNGQMPNYGANNNFQGNDTIGNFG